jgi:dienelactone hydrolase
VVNTRLFPRNRCAQNAEYYWTEPGNQEQKMRNIAISIVLMASVTGAAHAGLVTKAVNYSGDGITMKGYIVHDDSVQGKRPGVLVVHEWWGHNDYARSRAEMLARLGYTAMAIDMYGDGKTADHPKQAGEFSGMVRANMAGATQRFEAARATLAAEPTVDADRIAAIGYCFGGGMVLEMARRGIDLKGVVSIHGSLGTGTPAGPGDIKAKILVLHGAADPFVKPEAIKAFKQEMKSAKADFKFVSYPGAKHAFSNPAATAKGKQFNIPLEYNKAADRKSWQEMTRFLKSTLKK